MKNRHVKRTYALERVVTGQSLANLFPFSGPPSTRSYSHFIILATTFWFLAATLAKWLQEPGSQVLPLSKGLMYT